MDGGKEQGGTRMENRERRGERGGWGMGNGDLKAVQSVAHHYGVRIIPAHELSTYLQRLLQGSGV